MEFEAKQIAALLGGTIEGSPDAVVNSFAKIEEGTPGAITFLYDDHYLPQLYTTQASVVLLNEDIKVDGDVKATLIRVKDARACVAKLLTIYQQSLVQPRNGVHPTAVIASTAEVSPDAYIGPHAYVGEYAKIGSGSQIYANVVVEERASVGADSILYPNVTIYHDCHIGNRVILHAGCVIGADGFGFVPQGESYEKIPQIGNVVVEDDVEIGANACVDRAMMGSTTICRGVKLDNLVQIAHNCVVGENTVMSAQVGVAGSAKIGAWCMLGGQVGVAGHITVADRTQCGAQAGIAGSVRRPGQTIIGSPAFDARAFARSSAVFKNLPDMWASVNGIKKQLDAAKEDNNL